MKKATFIFIIFFLALSNASFAQQSAAPAATSENTVFPSYPNGGDPAMYKYLATAVKVPNSASRVTGTVTVYFIVDEQGMPTGHRVFKSIGDTAYDNAALDAVKSIARWTPGAMAGKVRKMGTKVMVNF
jgi:TonB family protein